MTTVICPTTPATVFDEAPGGTVHPARNATTRPFAFAAQRTGRKLVIIIDQDYDPARSSGHEIPFGKSDARAR